MGLKVMKCPICGKRGAVLDSRYTETYIRRRRICTECGERYTTYEMSVSHLSEIMEKLFAKELIARAGVAAGEAVSRTLRNAVSSMEDIRKALQEENNE